MKTKKDETKKNRENLTWLNFRSDWHHSGTVKALENYIGCGFKFRGPGWYIVQDGDVSTDLIIPQTFGKDESPWKKEWPADTIFEFHHFESDPRQSLASLAKAPTRHSLLLK